MLTFETTTDLMPHQVPAVAKMLPPRVGGLFMDMGTGKSRTLIEIAKRRSGKFRKAFWFTPCALRENVRQQLLTHTNLPESQIAVWDDRTLTQGIPATAGVHIVGTETMSASDRAVLTYNAELSPDDFVAVDESDLIKGWQAKRSQRIRNMSARSKYRLAMTGTPFSQGPVDLYSQMMFLSDKILGYRSFWSFAANHLEYEEKTDAFGRRKRTGRILRTFNEEYLAARIAPYVYQVRKDECLNLPPKLTEDRYFSMTHEQRELYEQAKDEILALDYDDWSPIRIFHLFTSLQTITCGFWRKPDGKLVEVGHNRLESLSYNLMGVPDGEKVIIWGKYIPAITQICEMLSATYGPDSVARYDGSVPQKTRKQNLERWRREARFLVGTQSMGGRGLTLTESAYTIFYADSFKYSERRHSEDRTHRIGTIRSPYYGTHICSDSIDVRIARSQHVKGNALKAFQNEIAACQKNRLKQRALELVRAL